VFNLSGGTMKYWLIYETFMGHRRIMAKRHRTAHEMEGIMKCFPGASFGEVDERTYGYMQVGDAW
jgi:hypothetical protein